MAGVSPGSTKEQGLRGFLQENKGTFQRLQLQKELINTLLSAEVVRETAGSRITSHRN